MYPTTSGNSISGALLGSLLIVSIISLVVTIFFAIVYWKRLPSVYHASFQVQLAERCWAAGEPEWFRDCRSSIHSWHTQPWNLPDWPSE